MNSSQLRGYLTGLVLGDGYIGAGVTKRSFEIKSINSDFIGKIYKEVSSCTNFKTMINIYPEYVDDKGIHHKRVYSFKVKAHPYFNKKYNYFYNDKGARRITTESLNWLNLVGLANWYMSDGYICLVGKTKGKITSRRVDLCTDRYTKNDVDKIRDYLLKVWGWETTLIRRRNKNKLTYRIRFKLIHAQDFLYKISPYITPSFMYKLDLHYDYQPQWMTDEYYHLMTQIEKCEHLTQEAA